MGYAHQKYAQLIGDHIFYRFPGTPYPSIKLGSLGYVEVRYGSGDYFGILEGSTQTIRVTYIANITTITGGGVTGDALKLKANTIDATPYLSLTGASDALLGLPAGQIFSIAIGGTGIAKIAPGGAGAGGIIQLRETTTPTPSADFGAIYTKADNHLYWQSGAGIEYDLGGA